ncbi:hypothetical protein BJY52DRAFT_1190684 [Lactarius psammicola]|nr:hypothetical protein BJY52DRAFT_1190684 [Lactarius psammicola]
MVLNDMSRQLYTHLVSDDAAQRKANQHSLDWLFVEAQQQLGPFMTEWKGLYKHALVQVLKDNEEDQEESPENVGYIKLFAYNCAKEIHKSIAQEVTDPILNGDEISHARERIQLDHAEEIEAARRDMRAQISSEKKVWAVAFHNSNKLAWLMKVVEEMGFMLVSKDDAKEREGRMAKCCTGPSSSVLATPENHPRKLENLQTPKACKMKGKRPLAAPCPLWSWSNLTISQPSNLSDAPDVDMEEIKQPLFFASSYPETSAALQAVTDRTPKESLLISGISIPQLVQPSQAPDAPLHNPKATLLEPDMDVSVYATSRQQSLAPVMIPLPPDPSPLSRVLTPDSTRGVASSMHNPENAMADDPLAISQPEVVVIPPALPPLQAIPLLPGLAEMLNALQANLMTSFTAQINHLSSRIDAQDEVPLAPSEVLPVLDPLLVPRPPPTPSAPHPPCAILLDKTTWAGVVTPSNFMQNNRAKVTANMNANTIGRTPGGALRKGRGANPTSVENMEITIACGEGLQDKDAEGKLYKSNPGNIVQVACNAMERMSAQAPPVLYGRWSVNANSHNFMYVFAGVVPFSTILQFSKNPLDADGFTTVGKGGKDAAATPAKLSRNAKCTQAWWAKKAAGGSNTPGLSMASPSNPNTNGGAQGSSVGTILFPEDVATITEMIDAFRKLAYMVCDGSGNDLHRAMTELEGGWGAHTEHLDNLFGLSARYAVKHGLPLTIPQTEDEVACGEGGLEAATGHVHAFCANWGSTQPIHFVFHLLPPNTHFTTTEEVDTQRSRQAKTSDRMRQFNDAVDFTMNLAQSLFENNMISRPLLGLEVEVIITTHSLDSLFSLDNPGPIGDCVAEAIKSHIVQDALWLFSLSSITSYA